jgi:alpha-tubulin suppressor-like RCC1 family protein
VRCWGYNGSGQLGDGTTTNRSSPVSISIAGAIDIVAGRSHTCAELTTNGSPIMCWGSNGSGQLGDGTTTNRSSPVSVTGTENTSTISAGGYHTCTKMSDLTLKCWGGNSFGQVGDGSTTNRHNPVTVPGLSGVKEVSAGLEHTCVRLSANTVQCWGYNGQGQLGDGSTTDRSTPVTVSGISTALDVTAGGDHTCARLSGGVAKCWGDNDDGQLGDGTFIDQLTAIAVPNLSNVSAIEAGSRGTCVRHSDGTAKCWGDNSGIALGVGAHSRSMIRPIPMEHSSNRFYSAIAMGFRHSCGLTAGGGVECWGWNWEGQLGRGFTSGILNYPDYVVGLESGVVSVAAG